MEHEEITYHVIEEENETHPLEIDGSILKLKRNISLDYERLPETQKHVPISISSVASTSVYTKQFLIDILGKLTNYFIIPPFKKSTYTHHLDSALHIAKTKLTIS